MNQPDPLTWSLFKIFYVPFFFGMSLFLLVLCPMASVITFWGLWVLIRKR